MFILRNILSPFQQEFNHRCKGDERGAWFVYTLLAVTIHFISSHTANILYLLCRNCSTLFLGLYHSVTWNHFINCRAYEVQENGQNNW